MQQPYRQMVLASGAPMTCLDPPRTPPCDGAPARRRVPPIARAALLLLAAATPAVGVFFAAQRAEAGHIEISADALSRLQARKKAPSSHAALLPPPRPVTPVAPVAPPPPPPRSVAAWFDVGEHDPSAIVAGARRLQATGIDLTVADVQLARSTVDCFDAFGYWPAIAFPSQGNHATALDLGDLPSDSPALAAGVQKHDLLLSVDGYTINEWSSRDVEKIRGRGSVALELDRDGRRILLMLHWRTKWRPA